jgi:primosomal protein N'
LVTILLRGRPCVAVVWESESVPTGVKLASVEHIITPASIVSTAVRRHIEWCANVGCLSWSSALYAWSPPFLRKPTKADFLFLRNLIPRAVPQQLILTPGDRPESRQFFKAHSPYGADWFEPSLKEREAWGKFVTGEADAGIGGARALWAPWQNLTKIQVLQPEDITHYHEQQPYLSLVDAAMNLATESRALLSIRSHLPQLLGEKIWGPSFKGAQRPPHLTIYPHQGKELISPTLIEEIRTEINQNHPVRIIFNAHDRQVSTTTAGRKELKTLSGIESLTSQIRTQLQLATDDTRLSIGTRSLLHEPASPETHTIALHPDTQLTAERFADRLHVLGDLAGLGTGGRTHIVSRHPDDTLLTTLINQPENLLADEITERGHANLWPAGSMYAVSCPLTDGAVAAAEKLREELEPSMGSDWQLLGPIEQRWRTKQFVHLVLTGPQNSLLPLPLWEYLTNLEQPWRIQHNPWHIV